MKKIFMFILSILLLSGCNNKEILVTKCTLNKDNIQANYKLNSEYTIYSQKGVVNKVEIIETITSSTDAILDYFENYLNKNYQNLNKTYGGYNNKITKNDEKIISKTTIDYKIVNINKFSEDNNIIKNYINNKKELLLDGIKELYKSIGIICE